MTRVPLLLLSIVAAGGLAPAALAKDGAKPRPGASAAQFGDQPGLNGQDMMQGVVAPTRRQGAGQNQIMGDVFEGTGIRSREPARSVRNQPGIDTGNRVQGVGAGQSPVAGHVQEGSSGHAPRERPRRRGGRR